MQAKELGFTKKGCFVISFNGGEIYDMYRKKSIFKKPLAMPLVRRIFDEALQCGLHCQTYSDSEIVTEHDTEEVKALLFHRQDSIQSRSGCDRLF